MIFLYNTGSSLPKKNLFVHNKKTGAFFQSPCFEDYLPSNSYTDFLLSFESNDTLHDFIEETPFKELFLKKVFFKEKNNLLSYLKKYKPSLLGWSFFPGSILDIALENNLNIYSPTLLNLQEWHDFSVQDVREEKNQPKAYVLKAPLNMPTLITLHDQNPFLIKGNPMLHSYHYSESIQAPFLFTEFERTEVFPFSKNIGPSRNAIHYKEYIKEKILLATELYSYSDTFFKEFNIPFEELASKKNTYPLKKNTYKGSLSPSKIQTYRECPKKFEAIYIKKVSQHFSLFHSIGMYLHKYIKDFFFYRDNNILKDLDENIQNHLLEYLNPMCLFLDQFEGEFIFEKNFEYSNFSFRCDLLILGTENYLFDFKYSKIPSLKSILNYENVQITSYLKNLPFEVHTYGYLNFKDITKSLIFSKEKHNFKTYPIPENFLKNYEEESYSEKIFQDISFNAYPVNNSVCTYCPINTLCLESKS